MERALSLVIPSLVEDGVFGDVEYVGLSLENATDIGEQFSSSIALVVLRVRGTSEEETFPLVVKAHTKNQFMRDNFDLKGLFYNEMVMYTDILPVLRVDEQDYAQYYHGSVSNDGYEEDVLILENLKYKNFEKSRMKLFLDYGHIILALKKIAVFHSTSYILKHENRDKFVELGKKLKKLKVESKELNENSLVPIERGVNAFIKSHGQDEVIDRFLSTLKSGVYYSMFTEPDEPFGVICHGDFCNNNVVYKYDNEGCPVCCALLDFQMSCYGSPVRDLAFYLYMHTTSETREKYWDEFFKVYWDTLRESVPQHIPIPSLKDLLAHFASRAVYGYLISSFFIPILMDENRYEDEWGNLSKEEHMEIDRTRGGEAAEEKIRDIVHHAFHRQYIHAFLDFMKIKKS